MPGGKEAGASGTVYQLVTGLGSDKKQLFMTRLLKKGAVGSGAPVELLLGSPCKRGVDFYAILAGCLLLAWDHCGSEKTTRGDVAADSIIRSQDWGQETWF